jgi:hypothetical protein
MHSIYTRCIVGEICELMRGCGDETIARWVPFNPRPSTCRPRHGDLMHARIVLALRLGRGPGASPPTLEANMIGNWRMGIGSVGSRSQLTSAIFS